MQIHTGRVGYVEPLCGHAKRCLLPLLYGSEYEGTWKDDVEVKAGAGNVWRNVQQLHGAMIHIFDNDTSVLQGGL